MLRLLHIEYLKVKNTRYFWVFFSFFVLFLLSIPLFSKSFLDYLAGQGADILGLSINTLPFFDFVDIWQNLTYLYKWLAILLAFIPVISLSNEFRYGTIKQNVIDGMSRNELLLSKISFSIVLSAIVSVIVFFIGLWMGFMWSPVRDTSFIFKNVEFVMAYFLVLVGFQLFCILITLLIKKSGIVILLLLFYFFAIEAFSYGWIKWNLELPELTSIFPLRGMANIIQNPFPKYILQEVYSSIRPRDVMVFFTHASIYTGLSFWLFNKRDIR